MPDKHNIRRIFQSTPPRGRRPPSLPPGSISVVFQSTPPRGRRQSHTPTGMTVSGFQSTPPRGRRLIPVDNLLYKVIISIHASAREATALGWFFRQFMTFQSTPPRGRRLVQGLYREVETHFNPRLREGGDIQLCPY